MAPKVHGAQGRGEPEQEPEADGSPKGTIWANGQAQASLKTPEIFLVLCRTCLS